MKGSKLLLLVSLGMLLAGCGHRNSPLEKAVHRIPVYPASQVVNSDRWAEQDDRGDNRRSAMSWTLKTDDDQEKVANFYKSELPQAQSTENDGVLTLQYLPERAVEGELITIEIRPGEIKITEVVPEEKRP